MTISHQRPGLLFVLVAPAGAGKNRLMQSLMERIDHVKQLPTATTRPIRPGEQEGREHFYLTKEAFLKLEAEDRLLEWQIVHGNLYGIIRTPLEEALDEGRYIMADIEVLGAERAKAAYPDNVVSIFVQPPSLCTLIERMRARGDKDKEIAKRLTRVPMELAYSPRCDYLILNDDIDRASERLYNIVSAEINRQPLEGAKRDDVPPRTFSYHVEIVPTCGNEVLYRDAAPHFLSVATTNELLPHKPGLAALETLLGTSVSLENLITGGEPDGEFVPPVAFNCTAHNGEEIITFRYHYQLPRIQPPQGWSWQPGERVNEFQTAEQVS